MVSGYRPPKDAKVHELLGEGGVMGHSLFLPCPKSGFTDYQRMAIQAYANSLTYWRKLVLELDWGDDGVKVVLRKNLEGDADLQTDERPGLRERLRGPAYLATKRMGQALVNNGFMVREPIPVSLVTLAGKFDGYGILLRYPGGGQRDAAGVTLAYDTWVPMLADVFAREQSLRTEVIKDAGSTTVFFTRNKGFISSLYTTRFDYHILVPRKRKLADRIVLFAPASVRACRALAGRYKRDFNVGKPLPAWNVYGHSLIMSYKKGADGRIADDAYFANVKLMSEKLMKRFYVLAMVNHEPQAHTIVVTFYSGTNDRFQTSTVYSRAVVSERPKTTA